MSITYVVTTIHEPSDGLVTIAQQASKLGQRVVVIGDTKTPENWELKGVDFLSFHDQRRLSFSLAPHLPGNSYTRKMLGYLSAAEGGCSWIRETDDDNAPYETFFTPPPEEMSCRATSDESGWVNAYAYFTNRHVWPRGLPLSRVLEETPQRSEQPTCTVKEPYILQALADGDPDVDAIFRLTAADSSAITFRPKQPLAVGHGSWTPFNSQATTWPRALFALMYLPVTCTFRMTDIWRSFVAQRLLPGLGGTVVFTAATVHQDRNEHDLLSDFEQEIPGYLGTEKIRLLLDSTEIQGDSLNLLSDLRALYEALVDDNFLTPDELPVLDAWINDVRRLELAS